MTESICDNLLRNLSRFTSQKKLRMKAERVGLPGIISILQLAEITHKTRHSLKELPNRKHNNGSGTGELKRHSLQ